MPELCRLASTPRTPGAKVRVAELAARQWGVVTSGAARGEWSGSGRHLALAGREAAAPGPSRCVCRRSSLPGNGGEYWRRPCSTPAQARPEPCDRGVVVRNAAQPSRPACTSAPPADAGRCGACACTREEPAARVAQAPSPYPPCPDPPGHRGRRALHGAAPRAGRGRVPAPRDAGRGRGRARPRQARQRGAARRARLPPAPAGPHQEPDGGEVRAALRAPLALPHPQ